MPTKSLVLTQPDGLHARPAAQFVRLAGQFKSSVKVRSNGREANGKSILSVLALGASQGTAVDLDVQGDDAQLALPRLAAFLTEATSS
jgi:phosphotransferase system HPr (HPr) family protein